MNVGHETSADNCKLRTNEMHVQGKRREHAASARLTMHPQSIIIIEDDDLAFR